MIAFFVWIWDFQFILWIKPIRNYIIMNLLSASSMRMWTHNSRTRSPRAGVSGSLFDDRTIVPFKSNILVVGTQEMSFWITKTKYLCHIHSRSFTQLWSNVALAHLSALFFINYVKRFPYFLQGVRRFSPDFLFTQMLFSLLLLPFKEVGIFLLEYRKDECSYILSLCSSH